MMFAGDECYGDEITSETVDPMDTDDADEEDGGDGDEDFGDCEDGLSDLEADAMTLTSCGWGTDEDYGYFGDDDG